MKIEQAISAARERYAAPSDDDIEIDGNPYTLNVCYLDNGVPETHTITFANKNDALVMAREGVKWENTVHATVTHEPSGAEIFDAAGDFIA